MSTTLLAIYCFLIVAASVFGGWLPSLIRMTHLRTQLLMSFVAGLMLGIAMLHMLPHAAELLPTPARAGGAALVGVIAMFLLMRAFHVHAHDEFIETDLGHTPECDHGEGDHGEHAKSRHVPNAPHAHGHSHQHSHEHSHGQVLEFGWMGMFFGLGLHTLMDGVALGASVAAEAHHNPFLGLAGLGTFLAVMLHKPLDAFAITSVMRKDGWNTAQQGMINFLFSLTCPLGALMFYYGAAYMADSNVVLGWGLAISAGFFICISLADLLPEVAFHHHDRLKLTGALLLGVALAVAIESLPGHEHPSHDHGHPNSTTAENVGTPETP